MGVAVKDRIIKELDRMSEPELFRVLDSVQRSKQQIPPLSGEEFVRQFAGLIPADEMAAMERAIEVDCEQIDADNG